MAWKIPLVSRERLEEAQARIAKLEADNRRLLELVVPSLRKAAPAVEEDAGISEMSAKELAAIQPLGRPTIASVIWEANKEAQRRAETPGSLPLSVEVQERAMKPWKPYKKAANGD